MARKKADAKPDGPSVDADTEDSDKSTESRDLVIRVRSRLKIMMDADRHNREKAVDDFKFVNVPGNQWTAEQKKKRGKRPCWEYNKLRIKCKRIINEMRSNRPQGKVRGVEDSDKKTAEIYDGLIRNIWTTSDADTIADNAAEYQVSAGFGAWRVDNDYVDDSAFDQHLKICEISNPLASLWWDPADHTSTKANAEDWALITRISKAEYKRRWPKAEIVDIGDLEFDTDDDWVDDETVRICEYHFREPYEKTLYLTADGKTLDDEQIGLVPRETIVKTRKAKCFRIKTALVSGDSVLEKPKEIAGKHHSFVVMFGDHFVSDGKVHWSGLVRHSRDQQQSYNLARTAIDESVMNAPNQSKWWATAEQSKGHLDKWEQAFSENIPALLYNPDPKAPGSPQVMSFNPLNPALVEVARMNDADMASTSGIEDDNLGIDTSAKSGRAILAKQNQGALATFNFQDNMSKAHRRTYEILIDRIPLYYDTPRTLRILGTDGAEDYAQVNQIVQDPNTGEMVTINDLSKGRYDVTVTVGPAFATRRQEASQIYTELSQANPALMAVAGDLIMKSMDLPYSDDIAERMKSMLPPQIQQQMSQGKDMPPEVTQAMAQVEQASQMVQQQTQLLNQAQAEVEQSKTEAEKAQNAVKLEIAKLNVARAQFDADIAKREANLILQQAKAESDSGNEALAKDREQNGAEIQSVMTQVQQQQAEFMASMSQAFAELMARQQPVVVVPPKPRIARIEQQRINGQLVAVPIYEQTEGSLQ